MAATLGQWYVEIIAKGHAQVLSEIQAVRQQLDRADKEQVRQNREQKKRITEQRTLWAGLGSGIRASTLMASGAIYGLARAGLAGTTQSAALSVRFQQLSRELASLFLPEINKSIDALGRVVGWFRQMDSAGQRAVARMLTFGGVMTLAMRGHPLLAVGAGALAVLHDTKEGEQLLKSIVGLAKDLVRVMGPMLNDAVRTFKSALQDIIPVLSSIVGMVRDFVSALEFVDQARLPGELEDSSRDSGGGVARFGFRTGVSAVTGQGLVQTSSFMGGAPKGAPRNRQELFPAGGAWEQFAETFRRVQSAVVQEDIPNQQLRELQRIRELLTRRVEQTGIGGGASVAGGAVASAVGGAMAGLLGP